MAKIKILEVGPRDGLQNEAKALTVAQRIQLISKLSDAGLVNIEIGAFVSPKWVPQMTGTNKVVKSIYKKQSSGSIGKGVKFSSLVPNIHGMQEAIKTPIKEIAIFAACSESFSKKNINCSIKESFERFAEVIKVARKNKIKVRGYLSTAFGCPYEGKVSQARVVSLIEKLLDMGIYEVSVGDTIGVATPKQVEQLLKKSKHISNSKIAMHFHDTRGTALANVLKSLDMGIIKFDSSIGGLGGCPYARGASGNLATEDLAYMLQGMGLNANIDIEKMVKIKLWIEKILGRELPSHVGRSGLPTLLS